MIKNIIFDLGAVLLDIDLEAFKAALRKLRDENRFDFNHQEQGFYGAYERAEIGTSEFFETLAGQFSGPVDINKLKEAWALILKRPIPESIEFLQAVQGKYRLFLLSNTNQAHREQFDQVFDNYLGDGRFYDLFEKVFYSYEMGLIKPGKQIYAKVLTETGIEPEHTLFIDDNAANIAGAKSLGIEGWVFEGKDDWPQIAALLQKESGRP